MLDDDLSAASPARREHCDYTREGFSLAAAWHRGAAQEAALPPHCRRCGKAEHMRRHGRVSRVLRDLPENGRPAWRRVDVTRWRCGACGVTYTPTPQGTSARRRLTERLAQWLIEQAAWRPVSQLAQEAGVDEKTVRRLLGSG
ncbi:helix-turn-helix domain-containing protein [Caldimonas brevitalea]|uniref:TnpA transposase n=1 Tax=Caldimonas brevitalea TaxID=413882 RepID=A0A0G3BWA9_9BURK|nr:helix-turn-helix domain-containing protein [Caldimonas brevitalea]AKJ31686.1 TnpA transposase [Caldimonas brevitalea]